MLSCAKRIPHKSNVYLVIFQASWSSNEEYAGRGSKLLGGRMVGPSEVWRPQLRAVSLF